MENKDDIILFRVEPVDRQTLQSTASALGVNPSEFLRQVMRRAINLALGKADQPDQATE